MEVRSGLIWWSSVKPSSNGSPNYFLLDFREYDGLFRQLLRIEKTKRASVKAASELGWALLGLVRWGGG